MEDRDCSPRWVEENRIYLCTPRIQVTLPWTKGQSVFVFKWGNKQLNKQAGLVKAYIVLMNKGLCTELNLYLQLLSTGDLDFSCACDSSSSSFNTPYAHKSLPVSFTSSNFYQFPSHSPFYLITSGLQFIFHVIQYLWILLTVRSSLYSLLSVIWQSLVKHINPSTTHDPSRSRENSVISGLKNGVNHKTKVTLLLVYVSWVWDQFLIYSNSFEESYNTSPDSLV